MAVHAINQYTFEFWKGDPPGFHRRQVETFTRAGTTGTATKTLGKRGTQFTSELTSWFTSYPAARAMYPNYLGLIGANPVKVVFNNLAYFVLYKTLFLVEDVQEVNCQCHPRLVGPGTDYAGGAALVTRWTMTPILQ